MILPKKADFKKKETKVKEIEVWDSKNEISKAKENLLKRILEKKGGPRKIEGAETHETDPQLAPLPKHTST